MHCLYCGKEIGALRLLKDREFCSAAHRQKYKDRLGKVLTQIAAAPNPPPPPARFILDIPPSQGTTAFALSLWQSGGYTYPVLTRMEWPLVVEGTEPEPAPIFDQTGANTGPAPCMAWTVSPGPQPAERWLDRALSEGSFPRPAVRMAQAFALKIGTAPARPALCWRWVRVPAAEPVAAFLRAATAEAEAASLKAILPALPALALEAEQAPPELHEQWATAPFAEPAAAFLKASFAEERAGIRASVMPAVLGIEVETRTAPPALYPSWMPAPSAEPVAAFLRASTVEAEAASLKAILPAVPALAVKAEQAPPELHEQWAPSAAAEPAASFLKASVSEEQRQVHPAVIPAFGVESETRTAPPALCPSWIPVPFAEPAAAFVRAATTEAEAASLKAILPAVPALAVEVEHAPPELHEQWVPAPSAEPAAAFLRASFSEAHSGVRPAVTPAALGLRIETRTAPPALCASWMPAPSAEPAAAFVSASIAGPISAAPATGLPSFGILCEIEPLPLHDAPLDPPACERWVPPPAAEPAWRYLRAAFAAERPAPFVQAVPVLAATISRPHVPSVTALRRVPQPEPVMAGVWPRIADTPLDAAAGPMALCLPAISAAFTPDPAFTLRTAVAASPAEPVERLLTVAESGIAKKLKTPPMAAVASHTPAPRMVRPLTGPQAQPLESWLVASVAGPIVKAAKPALQPFAVTVTLRRSVTVAGSDPRQIAARAAEPVPAAARVATPQPIRTLQAALPESCPAQSRPAIPQPGYIPIEYHAQKTRSVLYQRDEWKSARFEPLPPRFPLRAALEKPEDLIKPKTPAPIFRMPEPRRARSAMMTHAGRVAAAVLIVTSIWLGGAALRSRGRVQARREESSFSPATRVLTAETRPSAAPASSRGSIARIRESLANRATMQVGEDFQSGMQNWGAGAQAYPVGWQRSADGYVRPGPLALFGPTKSFTDYRLEFFGQIETKGVGWAVRAKDEKNYHAMKFTVLEAGLRPIIALVHYDVINGKAGRPVQTPLNAMVHNNRPFQVAVKVRGNRLVTSLDGEEVDTFVNETRTAGGVGFFSDPGERARLYWARVTRNDDWLGHVCAFLSGDEAPATAELWPPSVGGGASDPWSPAGGPPALATAWMALPQFRRNYPRRRKQCLN